MTTLTVDAEKASRGCFIGLATLERGGHILTIEVAPKWGEADVVIENDWDPGQSITLDAAGVDALRRLLDQVAVFLAARGPRQ